MNIREKKELFEKLYGTDANVIEQQMVRYEALKKAYSQKFGTSPDASSIRLFSSPGRTEIGGNHTDHNLGKVLAASIQLDCIGAVEARADVIHVYDLTYNEDYEVSISDSERHEGEKGSIALLRGIIQGFKNAGYNVGGFNACFTSDVIAAAGVSSSASFEMMLGTILNCLYNDSKLTVSDIARVGQFAENTYWDKASGLLDQTACATGGLVTIDFAEPKKPVVQQIPFDFSSQGYSMMIVNTGKGHADLSAEYSSIPNEMKSVARFFKQETLRGLSFADIAENLPALRKECGDRAVLRAMHFFTENDRVDEEAAALKAGNFSAFLKGITASGNSSWKWLQNISVPGFPEEQPIAVCLALTEQFIKEYCANSMPAACRVHGGGFAGVIQAFIPNSLVEKYTAYMNTALGWKEGNGRSPVYRMGIRPLGSIEIK